MSIYFAKTKVILERSENLPQVATADNIALIPDIIFEYGKLLHDIKTDSIIQQSSLPDNLPIILACLNKAKNIINFNTKQQQYDEAKRLLVVDLTKLLNLLK